MSAPALFARTFWNRSRFLEDKVAKWWLPDDVAFVEGIPHTATGKLSKKTLREQFAGYSFPAATVPAPRD